MIQRTARWALWPLIVMVAAVDIAAEEIQAWPNSEADFALLPPYCNARHRRKEDPAKFQEWNKKLGKDMLHVHHYCAAMFANIQAKRTKHDGHREYYLKQVIGEIGYVESHASSSFVLMPEILVLKGKVMEQTGKGPEATVVYRKAIKLNPKYGWAYKALSDLFVSLSNPTEAKKVLQEGMAHAEGTNKKWFEQQIAILDEMTMKAGKGAQSAPPADEKK